MAHINNTSEASVETDAKEKQFSLTSTSIYRAVWRWHFYAGLLVLPFLIWLATTGALYVYHEAIDKQVHAELLTVPKQDSAPQSPSVLIAAAVKAQPGEWFKYTTPSSPDRSAEIGIRTAQGAKVAVYVNPYDAQVLGTLSDQGTLGWTIRKLHSLKYFGPIQRGFIEMAAGWALLLVITGLYLWWPRGRKAGVVTVRGTPRQRVYWRDLHAVTGLAVAIGLVFLAITGMPWSVFWGAKANELANGHNFGYPAGVRVQLPMSGHVLIDSTNLPWTLQHTQAPGKATESPHAMHGEEMPVEHQHEASLSSHETHLPKQLDLDTLMLHVQHLNLAPGYTVTPPRGAQGVFTASVYPHDLDKQRVVHIDQFTGQALLDISYADYGLLGKWLEWGINVHLGQEFGVANQLLLILICAGIVLLCVSGALMWIKRRPAKGMGVPPLPKQRKALAGVVVILAIGGLLFPLVGLSLAVMLLIDSVVIKYSGLEK